MVENIVTAGIQVEPTSFLHVDAGEGGAVALPEGVSLTNAEFSQDGSDLLLTFPDGTQVTVEGYFDLPSPPRLVAADGAEVPGEVATVLAAGSGPAAGEAAGAEGLSAGTEGVLALGPTEGRILVGSDGAAIGQVQNVSGLVFAIRPDGTRVQLEAGSPVYQGDVLESGSEGAIGVILADQTTFSMGENGKMVLDEMIYDPAAQTGSVSISVVQGVFIFVSGQVAKTDPDAMTLNTPFATIGIRGTQVGIELVEGQPMSVVLMEEKDGFVGEVVLTNAGGVRVMNNASDFTTVANFATLAAPITKLPDAQIIQTFAPALKSIPLVDKSQNDFGLQGDIKLGDRAAADRTAQFENAAATAAQFETAAGPGSLALAEVIKTVAGDYVEAGERIAAIDAGKVKESAPVAPPQAAIPEARIAPVAAEAVKIGPGSVSPSAPVDLDTVVFGGNFADYTIVIGEDGVLTVTGPNGVKTISGFDYLQFSDRTIAVSTLAPETPELAVADASGKEDTAIALDISAVVADPKESVTVTIAGVPAGAVLSAGADNGDGTWTLTAAELRGLALTPPANYSGAITLTVSVTSAESGQTATTVGSIVVNVAAVADAPTLDVRPAMGAEDTAIPLNIASAPTDPDETLSVTIAGVPEGAVLSAGTDNGDGTWTLTAAELRGLALTPPTNYSGEMALTVTATATDADGSTAVRTADLAIDVTPVADAPTLDVRPAMGAEDTAIPLNIAAAPTDPDETLGVTIAGVPKGAVLSAGADNGDGTWTLTADQLEGLTLTPGEDSAEDFTLSVTATTRAADGTTASTTATMAVTVAAVADVPTLSVVLGEPVITGGGDDDRDHGHGRGHDDDRPGRGVGHERHGEGHGHGHDHDDAEGVIRTFPLAITGALTDADSSETLSFTVGGIPAGAALSAGTDNGDGTWSLTAAQLTDLKLIVGEGVGDAFPITVSAIATEAEGDTATAVANVSVPAFDGSGGDGDHGGPGDWPGADDAIVGGAGDDELEGTAGDDTMLGRGGDDEIAGGKGDDTLYGGKGDDTLEGGKGDDALAGGEGRDTFIFDAKAGKDVITDIMNEDKIVFDGKEFNAKDMVFSENDSGDVVISFNGKSAPETSVTLEGVALSDLEPGGEGYTVTQNNDQLTVTLKLDEERR